jgi:site-specific DNA-methyltransferase (adenine-specific)
MPNIESLSHSYYLGQVELRKTDLFRRNVRIAIEPFGRAGYLTSEDALRFLSSLRDGIADVVFLDPPFNLGKDYGIRSEIEVTSTAEYEAYMTRVLSEAARVLKYGGALFLYHLPYWASRLSVPLMELLDFRHWIAVSMKNGFVRGDRLYPAHYALLYYTKGVPAHFRRPRLVPLRCRHCDALVKNYGGYTKIITAKGINLSDFWEDLSPVRHKSKKHRPANQLPSGLTDRVLHIAGRRGGIIIDPFAGAGTSLVSAYERGVQFVGNDLSRRNIGICRRRLLAVEKGE